MIIKGDFHFTHLSFSHRVIIANANDIARSAMSMLIISDVKCFKVFSYEYNNKSFFEDDKCMNNNDLVIVFSSHFDDNYIDKVCEFIKRNSKNKFILIAKEKWIYSILIEQLKGICYEMRNWDYIDKEILRYVYSNNVIVYSNKKGEGKSAYIKRRIKSELYKKVEILRRKAMEEIESELNEDKVFHFDIKCDDINYIEYLIYYYTSQRKEYKIYFEINSDICGDITKDKFSVYSSLVKIESKSELKEMIFCFAKNHSELNEKIQFISRILYYANKKQIYKICEENFTNANLISSEKCYDIIISEYHNFTLREIFIFISIAYNQLSSLIFHNEIFKLKEKEDHIQRKYFLITSLLYQIKNFFNIKDPFIYIDDNGKEIEINDRISNMYHINNSISVSNNNFVFYLKVKLLELSKIAYSIKIKREHENELLNILSIIDTDLVKNANLKSKFNIKSDIELTYEKDENEINNDYMHFISNWICLSEEEIYLIKRTFQYYISKNNEDKAKAVTKKTKVKGVYIIKKDNKNESKLNLLILSLYIIIVNKKKSYEDKHNLISSIENKTKKNMQIIIKKEKENVLKNYSLRINNNDDRYLRRYLDLYSIEIVLSVCCNFDIVICDINYGESEIEVEVQSTITNIKQNKTIKIKRRISNDIQKDNCIVIYHCEENEAEYKYHIDNMLNKHRIDVATLNEENVKLIDSLPFAFFNFFKRKTIHSMNDYINLLDDVGRNINMLTEDKIFDLFRIYFNGERDSLIRICQYMNIDIKKRRNEDINEIKEMINKRNNIVFYVNNIESKLYLLNKLYFLLRNDYSLTQTNSLCEYKQTNKEIINIITSSIDIVSEDNLKSIYIFNDYSFTPSHYAIKMYFTANNEQLINSQKLNYVTSLQDYISNTQIKSSKFAYVRSTNINDDNILDINTFFKIKKHISFNKDYIILLCDNMTSLCNYYISLLNLYHKHNKIITLLNYNNILHLNNEYFDNYLIEQISSENNSNHIISIIENAYQKVKLQINNKKDIIHLSLYINKRIKQLSQSKDISNLIRKYFNDEDYTLKIIKYCEIENLINEDDDYIVVKDDIIDEEIICYFDLRIPHIIRKVKKILNDTQTYIDEYRTYQTIIYHNEDNQNIQRDIKYQIEHLTKIITTIINKIIFENESKRNINDYIHDLILYFVISELKAQFKCNKVIKELFNKNDLVTIAINLIVNKEIIKMICKTIEICCDVYEIEGEMIQLFTIDEIISLINKEKYLIDTIKNLYIKIYETLLIKDKTYSYPYIEITSNLIKSFNLISLHLKDNDDIINNIIYSCYVINKYAIITNKVIDINLLNNHIKDIVYNIKCNQCNSTDKVVLYENIIKLNHLLHNDCLICLLYDILNDSSFIKESGFIVLEINKIINKDIIDYISLSSTNVDSIYNVYFDKYKIKIDNDIACDIANLIIKTYSHISNLNDNYDTFKQHLLNLSQCNNNQTATFSILKSIAYIKHYLAQYINTLINEYTHNIKSSLIDISNELNLVLSLNNLNHSFNYNVLEIVKLYLLKYINNSTDISLNNIDYEKANIKWINKSLLQTNSNILSIEPSISFYDQYTNEYYIQLSNLCNDINNETYLSSFTKLIQKSINEAHIQFIILQFFITKIYLNYTNSSLVTNNDTLNTTIQSIVRKYYSSPFCTFISNIILNFPSFPLYHLSPSSSPYETGLLITSLLSFAYFICNPSKSNPISQLYHNNQTEIISSFAQWKSVYFPGGLVSFHDENIYTLIDDLNENFGQYGRNVGLYQCNCGFFYTIGNCTRPYVISKCPLCNGKVGGLSHKLVEGHKCIINVEKIPPKEEVIRYMLDSLDDQPGFIDKEPNEIHFQFKIRNISPISFRFFNLMLYSSIVLLISNTFAYQSNVVIFNKAEKHITNTIEKLKKLLSQYIQNGNDSYIAMLIFLNDYVNALNSEPITSLDMKKKTSRDIIESEFEEKIFKRKINFISIEIRKYKDSHSTQNQFSYLSLINESYTANDISSISYGYLLSQFKYNTTIKFERIKTIEMRILDKRKEQIEILNEALYEIISFSNYIRTKCDMLFMRNEAKEIKIANIITSKEDKDKFESFNAIWSKYANQIKGYQCKQLETIHSFDPNSHSIAFLLIDDTEYGYGMYIAAAYQYFMEIQNEIINEIEYEMRDEDLNNIYPTIPIQYIRKCNIVSNNALIRNSAKMSIDNLICMRYQLEILSLKSKYSNIISEICESVPQEKCDSNLISHFANANQRKFIAMLSLMEIAMCEIKFYIADIKSNIISSFGDLISKANLNVKYHTFYEECEFILSLPITQIVSLHYEIEIAFYDNIHNVLISNTLYGNSLSEEERSEINKMYNGESKIKICELINAIKCFSIRNLIRGDFSNEFAISEYLNREDIWEITVTESQIDEMVERFPSEIKISKIKETIEWLMKINKTINSNN